MCYLYYVGKNSSTGVPHHVRHESRLCLYIIAMESAGRYCSTVSVQNSHNRYILHPIYYHTVLFAALYKIVGTQ